MPNKNTKRARRAAAQLSTRPAPTDDGTRWLVVRDAACVYGSTTGTSKAEALRLARGLLEPAEIIQVSVT